jgi:hypothetical protein
MFVWACDEKRGNKYSRSYYENEHCKEKRKRKTKKINDWEQLRMI